MDLQPIAGKMRLHLLRISGLLLLILLWQLASSLARSPILPTPIETFQTLIELRESDSIRTHILISLMHIGAGYGMAAGLGLLAGIAMAHFMPLQLMLMPAIDALRNISAMALFPAIILLLGLGVESKAFVIFWTAYPAIVLNTLQGIRAVDETYVSVIQLDTNNRFHILRYIQLPLASGSILTGLRVGLSGGWISLVAAEMLGGNAGLGYFVLQSSQTFQFKAMYAGIILIALIGLVFNSLLWFVQHLVEAKYL